MPELPDLTVYAEALEARLLGQPVTRLRLGSPFLLRTVEPPASAFEGRTVRQVRRLGKRLVLSVDDDLHLALHLMVAGRLHWKAAAGPDAPRPAVSGRGALLALDFPVGTLTLTEAGTRRRVALHLLAGEAALKALDRGGVEPLQATPAEFAAALRRERHTLKRALTDPALFAGIGNAYSDELLHRAGLSPVAMTTSLDDAAVARLQEATRATLTEWTARLRAEAAGGFPEQVTAFREGMAVHGRHRRPCPACGTLVQRIVRAENEVNYCPRCQTGGRILSDRSLARLLKADWPRTVEELEQHPALSRARDPGGPGA